MELKDVAEQILFGDSLDDKLIFPDTVSDMDPGYSGPFPDFPGRPEVLRPGGGSKSKFPSIARFDEPQVRGQALHFFANHELLALEIMALALLKFPDAPRGFRLGLLGTIKDEQKHLRMYLSRMRELGIDFGECGFNTFFWDVSRCMRNPMDYVANISLTFEQANLDFCEQYESLCRQVEDFKTASLLQTVHADEIRHVAFGVSYAQRSKPWQRDFWNAYRQHLEFPMSPGRAKGKYFSRISRQKAGFPDRFIDELAVYSESRGRKPDIWLFNPAYESEVSKPEVCHETQLVRQIENDLAPLLLHLMNRDDVLVCQKVPSIEFRKQMDEIGVRNPEYLPENELPTLRSGSRKFAHIQAWGHSPRVRSWTQRYFAPGQTQKVLSNAALLKDAQVTRLDLGGHFAKVCCSRSEILDSIGKWTDSGHTKFVAKKIDQSSGRGQKRWQGEPDVKTWQWIDKVLETEGVLVMERWLDKLHDFSTLLYKSRNESAKFLGCRRFFTDPRGQYLGHWLPGAFSGLSQAEIEILQRLGQGGGFLALIESQIQKLDLLLDEVGYVGRLAIDSLVFIENGQPSFRPFVEVNFRTTMGHIAQGIEKIVHPGSIAKVMQAAIPAQIEHPTQFWQRLREKFPLAQSSGKLVEGVTFLNDWTNLQRVAVLLLVSSNIEGLEQIESCLWAD